MRVVAGISVPSASTVGALHVQDEKIVDAKFLDGMTLVLLVSGGGMTLHSQYEMDHADQHPQGPILKLFSCRSARLS